MAPPPGASASWRAPHGGPLAVQLSREAVALTLANRPSDAQQAVEAVSRVLNDGSAGIEGRHAIDVAFNLALAGAADSALLDLLANMSEDELRTQRWRRRGWSKPRSAYTLVQMAERAAGAGLCSPLGLYDILGELLSESPEFPQVSAELQRGAMWLGHERAASWLYRAARKQTKLTVAAADAPLDPESLASGSPTRLGASATAVRLGTGVVSSLCSFEDGDRPLVVDLGCGYGVGALTAGAGGCPGGGSSSRANYLGCDLSPQGVGFARGVAARWGLSGRAAFVRRDALAVLRDVGQQYHGPVAAVVLCCPSPYRAAPPPAVQPMHAHKAYAGTRGRATGGRGNSQLPDSADSHSFLGRMAVLREAARVLAPGGWLLLSSNAEDVAVAMVSAARELGLEIAELESEPSGRPTELTGHTRVSHLSLCDRLQSVTERSAASGSASIAPYARGNLMTPAAGGSWLSELSPGPTALSETAAAFDGGALSRRSVRWREQGGVRADGRGWCRGSGWRVTEQGRWDDVAAALGRRAWSETELAHEVDGAAVHRMLLHKPA